MPHMSEVEAQGAYRKFEAALKPGEAGLTFVQWLMANKIVFSVIPVEKRPPWMKE